MASAELGTKRVCVNCGARFYDLQRSPAICPKCGTEQPPDQPRMRRPGGAPVEDKRPKKPVIVPGLDEPEAEPAEDEAEEDVLEDTNELEDDADVIGGEIEVEPEADEKDL